MSYLIRFYFTLIIILTSTLLFGQDNRIDTIWENSKQLWYDGEFQLVIDTLKVALSIIEAGEYQDKLKQETLAAKMYRNIGMSQRRLFMYKRAEQNLDTAIEKYQYILSDANAVRKDTSRLGICFQHKALLMIDWGEFEKAFSYANEAQQIFTEIKEPHNQVRIGNVIAGIYYELGEFEKAENTALHTIQIYHKEEIDKPNLLCDLHTILANTQVEQEKYIETEKNHNIALDVTTHTLDSAGTYNNLGILHTRTKQYKTAASNFNQSLNIKKRIYKSEYHFSYASTFENFGDLKVAQNDFDAALNYYQLALINLTDNFRNKNINTNPKTIDNHYIYNKPDLLRVLDLKAQAALKNGNIDLAYDIYQVLDDWINEFYKDLSTNASKLLWIDRAHTIYGNAIEVALMYEKPEKAFEYAEKAHAVLLWQSLSQQAARSLLSEKDKEKIDDLTAKIRQADQQYRYGEIKIDALRSLEREREALEKTLEDKYPDYAQRKYQSEATTVSDIQSKIIDDQTAFIEYYQTDDTLYIFTITKNGLKVTQKNVDVTDDISNFVKNISNDNMNGENYHTLAHKLYKQLIPESIDSNDNINRLVIVPDREIGTLPFAALAIQATSGQLGKNTPFLVKKYTTNYFYSAGSYLQLQQQDADQKYCFAGIAPVEYKIEGWDKLEHAGQELDDIKSLHWWSEREILKEAAATKAAFKNIIKAGYKTILVSTHAVYDENGGQIIFRDSILTQDEIDLLEINTHRLILSACETGVGEQNQGEGILSLGWNFAYKGVPSITMTHWKVNEFTTKEIIVSYNENLNNEMPADQALREAQLEYLRFDKNKIILRFEPHYWAGFFHTGNIN